MPAIDLFSDKSDLYAAARPQYPESLYTFLVSCTDSKKRVWDCAAGNGQASIALANYFTEVHATDLSQQQIANAMPKHNVFYSVQPAETTNFPEAYFDAVTVAQALHWFDLDQFWSEVKRVLKNGGIFAAWGYTDLCIAAEIDAIIKNNLLDIIEPYWSPRIHYLRNGYQDIAIPFEPIQVPSMPMSVTWNLSELLRYMHTWSATRQYMKQYGMEFFEILTERLSSVWGQPEEKKTINIRFYAVMGRN
ncbi:MAG: class I SAM-dependent methyltransferase [Cyanobacteria bacterium P01_F01_bin.86]